MAYQEAHPRAYPRKSWTECGACFALAVTALGAAALGLQWVLHLI
ncbi:MAG: hypothetical protein JWP35_1492 [Caulobacter sp.]|nr:hypothetical protein [Caulobacter sp.]